MKATAKRPQFTKKRRSKKCLPHNIQKLLSETVLHGLKYVADDDLPMWTRMLFLIAFVVALVVAFIFITPIYEKWRNSPVINGKNPIAASVDSIPFPAVTICNMNKFLRSKVQNYREGSLEYAYLKRGCFQPYNFSSYSNLKPRQGEETFSKFMVKNGQLCSRLFVFCKLFNEIKNCSQLFREILTDEGMCCSFNTLHPYYLYKGDYEFLTNFATGNGRIPVDWSPQKGYQADLPLWYSPRRAKGAGHSLGLSLVLNAEIEEYYCSSTFGAGFKIFLHNPIDTPHMKEVGLPVSIGYETKFRLEVASSEALLATRSISPQQRQCYFSDERQLLYHKYYSRHNCEWECIAQYMVRSCKCVPHHMPFVLANTSVCNVRKAACIEAAEERFLDEEGERCKRECLACCFDLRFSAKAFAAPLTGNSFVQNDPVLERFSRNYSEENFAFVQVYYARILFRSKVRTPYTKFTDFLAQAGGIINFLLGFSVVSIAEIIYYIIWYPVVDFRRNNTKSPSNLAARQINLNPIAEDYGTEMNLHQEQQIFFLKNDYKSFRIRPSLYEHKEATKREPLWSQSTSYEQRRRWFKSTF